MSSRSRHALHIAPCPCGSEQPYTLCCERWHAGWSQQEYAPSAQALMRSRYSAYALGLIDYLLATWHPSTAPGELELPPVKWLSLDVRQATESADAAVVEFVALYRVNGRAERMHEVSRFVRQDGCWYYIDGHTPQAA
ncbi:MAG: SEC-C domain-containing protein [Rhodoferax sp.]|nr:SEC-C domain-containing protein [Rhodoferax sp.]